MRKVVRAMVAGSLIAAIVAGCTTSAPAPTSPPPDVAASAASPGAVAPPAERTFFVSSTGDDSAPGSEARPLRTPQAAQLAVRALLAQDPRTNVRVNIGSGTYPLAATLAFDQRDSPADGFTVRYIGPADASAVLSGDRPVTGWERVAGDIYRARLPQGIASPTLWENDARGILARMPNEGYLRVASAVGAAGSNTQFVYAAGDLPDGAEIAATAYVWSGCNAQLGANYDWETDVIPVKTIDRATRTVTLGEAAWFPICAGNRYRLLGARSFLDRPGEYAVDEREGYVYYWPRTLPIEAQRVVVAGLSRLVEVKGASGSTPARNIAFERLSFVHTGYPSMAKANTPGLTHAAIHLENAEHIAIRGSRIADVGGTGILLRSHAQRNVIEGDLIERVGVYGIWISGPPNGAPRTSRDNRITDDRIRSGGLFHGSGSGIRIENSAANEIANNEISDMPRYGISLKGATLRNIQQFQPQLGATQQNLNDLRHSRENVIRRNDVSKVMTDSQDGGGIELWGAGTGNRIEENRVHDIDTGDRREGFASLTVARGPLLKGIYLDDGSDGNAVKGNVVYGIRGPNANTASIKGLGNEVIGNVFVSDGELAGLDSSREADTPVGGLRITGNIFARGPGTDVYWFKSFSDSWLAEADRNLFFHSAQRYTVRFEFAGRTLTLEEWRTRYAFDKASVTGDPLFVDAARGDYRVREGSPALKLGFINVDPAGVGPRAGAAFGR